MSNKEENPYTDEMRRAFNEVLERTVVAGHGPGCEHGAAMQGCITAFAGENFDVADSAITWLMLFIEMSLMLPPAMRERFSMDMCTQIGILTDGLKNLPQDCHVKLTKKHH